MIKLSARILISGSLLASILFVSPGTQAAPVTIDFTVTATSAWDGADNFNATSYNGYTVGALGSGSFTFDDALGNFHDTVVGAVASDLSFTWLGTTWTADNARIWDLSFNSSGVLQRWGLGGVPGTCGLNCFNNPGPTDFYLNAFIPGSSQGSEAALHQQGISGAMRGSVNWSVHPAAVPLPGALGLFSLGLLSVAARRKLKN